MAAQGDIMAARKQLWHPDEVRQKIQASQLINRLMKHALSTEGPLMDPSQVTAAVKLLGKVLPDLKAIEHTGEGGGPIQVSTVERIVVRPQDPDPNS